MNKEAASQEKLKILIADDLDDAVEQLKGWIRSYWPDVELHVAQTPEATVALACEQQIENRECSQIDRLDLHKPLIFNRK